MNVFIIIVILCSCNLHMKCLSRLLLRSTFTFLLEVALHLSVLGLIVTLLLAVCTFTQLWLSISSFPLSPLSFILCLSFSLLKMSNECSLRSWLELLRLFLHQDVIDDHMSYSKLQNMSETCLTSIWHQIPMVIWSFCVQNFVGSLILYNGLNSTKSPQLFHFIWVKIQSYSSVFIA